MSISLYNTRTVHMFRKKNELYMVSLKQPTRLGLPTCSKFQREANYLFPVCGPRRLAQTDASGISGFGSRRVAPFLR
jgi:hypothetical protein